MTSGVAPGAGVTAAGVVSGATAGALVALGALASAFASGVLEGWNRFFVGRSGHTTASRTRCGDGPGGGCFELPAADLSAEAEGVDVCPDILEGQVHGVAKPFAYRSRTFDAP